MLEALGAACHAGFEADVAPELVLSLRRDPTFAGGPLLPEARRAGPGVQELGYYGWRATWDEVAGTIDGRLASPSPPMLDRKRVESLTRSVLGQRLLAVGGLSMHGAAMVRDGKGYLFVGPRGAGKTTVVRRWPGERVLGDDHAIVVREGASWRLYGTPYTGREKTPCVAGDAPLAAILLLGKSSETRSRGATAAEAFRALVQQVIHIGREPDDTRRVVSLLEALVQSVPISRLEVSLSHPLWPAVLAA